MYLFSFRGPVAAECHLTSVPHSSDLTSTASCVLNAFVHTDMHIHTKPSDVLAGEKWTVHPLQSDVASVLPPSLSLSHFLLVSLSYRLDVSVPREPGIAAGGELLFRKLGMLEKDR